MKYAASALALFSSLVFLHLWTPHRRARVALSMTAGIDLVVIVGGLLLAFIAALILKAVQDRKTKREASQLWDELAQADRTKA